MVELRNVCKSFGDVQVLDGVNLRLEKGFGKTIFSTTLKKQVAMETT